MLSPCRILYCRIKRGKHLVALHANAVKCTAFDKALNRTLVDRPQINAHAKVHE